MGEEGGIAKNGRGGRDSKTRKRRGIAKHRR
jgi:hypothetical protein